MPKNVKKKKDKAADFTVRPSSFLGETDSSCAPMIPESQIETWQRKATGK
jgi:hypothetical protein